MKLKKKFKEKTKGKLPISYQTEISIHKLIRRKKYAM